MITEQRALKHETNKTDRNPPEKHIKDWAKCPVIQGFDLAKPILDWTLSTDLSNTISRPANLFISAQLHSTPEILIQTPRGHAIDCVHNYYLGVRIKRVNFRENKNDIFQCPDKRNCPLYMSICIEQVSVEQSSTVLKTTYVLLTHYIYTLCNISTFFTQVILLSINC